MNKLEVEEEQQTLTDNRNKLNNLEETLKESNLMDSEKKKNKKKKQKKKKAKKENEEESESEESKIFKEENRKKAQLNNDQFIINQRYYLVKMLGSGSFGEIHLSFDSQEKRLLAMKFELINSKNPQLKHEFNILEQLNKADSNDLPKIGIPKVYGYDKMESKCNYMLMDFLGPSLSDLFVFQNKKFSLITVCGIAIQLLQRIEYVHSKGFIHRDIKPENFLLGLNENSNNIYIIDFGLSKRFKDKNTHQHIPYRENRHLIGTARYASINAHLGVEQSRRDDLESIGYLLIYFINGRLPWQNKLEKGKYPKITEKKLITPPEILCKKLPGIYCLTLVEFSYYFYYCKNLRFDDKPDYSMLKGIFYEVLMDNLTANTELIYDWFKDVDITNSDPNSLKKKNTLLDNYNDIVKEDTLTETPDINNFKESKVFNSELVMIRKNTIIGSLKNYCDSSKSGSEDDNNDTERINEVKNGDVEDFKNFVVESNYSSNRFSEGRISSKLVDIGSDQLNNIVLKSAKNDFKSSSDSNYNLFRKSDSAGSSKKNKGQNLDPAAEIVLKQVDNQQMLEKDEQITLEIHQNNDINSIDLEN